MAGIVEVKSLEERRRALVAESEAYRQSLRLELENLRLYSTRVKQRWQLLKAAKPLLVVLPLVGVLFAKRSIEPSHRKSSTWRKWLGVAMTGWRAYRGASPLLGAMASLREKRRSAPRSGRT